MEIQPYNHLDQDNSENMLEPETTNISDVTIVSDDVRRSLTINQKSILSKLYKLGDAIERKKSHHCFQVECLSAGLNPNFTVFSKRKLKGNKEKLEKASQSVTEEARDFFGEKIDVLEAKVDVLNNALKRRSTKI